MTLSKLHQWAKMIPFSVLKAHHIELSNFHQNLHAVKVPQERHTDWHVVLRLVLRLEHSVSLQCVRARSGHIYNRLCDQRAHLVDSIHHFVQPFLQVIYIRYGIVFLDVMIVSLADHILDHDLVYHPWDFCEF